MVAFYRQLGRGWQTRINDVLYCYMHSIRGKLIEQPGERDWNGKPL